MTDVLEVVGLCCLVVGAFLVALWLGLIVLGSGCLAVSWSITRRRRLTVEAEQATLAARRAAMAR